MNISKNLPALCLLAALSLLAGCAGRGPAPVPGAALAVEGPPLALVGEYAGLGFTGSMDRTAMAGYGNIAIESRDVPPFVCQGKIDGLPTKKGRVRGVMECTAGRLIYFSLRNLGPDQGVGIGRESPEGELLILFYHASAEEAARRFPAEKEAILKAKAGGRK